MVLDFIVYILSSLLIIYSIHSLYNYLKKKYTTKKTKDLVIFHLDKYQDILETVNKKINKFDDFKNKTIDNEEEYISNTEKDILQNSLLELIKEDI